MYTKVAQSNIKSPHVHTLIVAKPSLDDELDTVMRCTSCHRIMLMENDGNGGGAIFSHQCPPKALH